jgi:hypothetical protein
MEGNPAQPYDTGDSPLAATADGDAAEYATVWSTVAYKVKATNLLNPKSDDVEAVYPAGHVVQIPNITAETQITVTEL